MLPTREAEAADVTKCSTTTPSSSTAIWVYRAPSCGGSLRSLSRTTIVRSTASRRARKSGSARSGGRRGSAARAARAATAAAGCALTAVVVVAAVVVVGIIGGFGGLVGLGRRVLVVGAGFVAALLAAPATAAAAAPTPALGGWPAR